MRFSSIERISSTLNLEALRAEGRLTMDQVFSFQEVDDQAPDGFISRELIKSRMLDMMVNTRYSNLLTTLLEETKSETDINCRLAYEICCAVNRFPMNEAMVTQDFVVDLTYLDMPPETREFQGQLSGFVFRHRRVLQRLLMQAVTNRRTSD